MRVSEQQSPFDMSCIDMKKIGEESQKVLEKFMSDHDEALEGTTHITKAFVELAEKWTTNPEAMIQKQLELYQSYLSLWANMAERMMGKEVSPVVSPTRDDRRFKAEEWENNLVFDYLKQSYLLTCNWVVDQIQTTNDVSPQAKAKVDFYTRQFLDAMSPTNFPLTNPEVLQKTVETKGENLIKGLKNLLSDMERGGGKLRISMTDYDAFEVGKNLATTEGAVVYQNRMFQLIQYKPKGKQVYEKPLLISPPWINKFYILDMQEKNSFVRYAVEECGLQVFMISWKNPDETYRDVGWEEYMKEGILEAVDQTLAITGQKDLNMIGYCIGGTLLTTTLAYMAKKKDKRINSATYFTTLMDFTNAGELSLFTDEEQISNLEKKMEKQGYLDGKEMATTFAMLRSNDLIWSFVINNYMMGADPFPFDLLYWNDDPTCMPAKMHSFYLRNMYLENNLVKKDKIKLLGEKIDITQIDQPIYMVGAINDHITPWESCFSPLHTMKSEDITFVLGKAGHVAGVACPPGNPKRAFWEGKVTSKESNPEKWLAKQEMKNDSWWPDWKNWVGKKSGKKVTSPTKLGDAKHKIIEAAPGSYVKEKS